jgi:hypothetical protein
MIVFFFKGKNSQFLSIIKNVNHNLLQGNIYKNKWRYGPPKRVPISLHTVVSIVKLPSPVQLSRAVPS